MACTTNAAEFFRGSGVTNDKIDNLFVVAYSKMDGKKLIIRYIN